MTRREFLKGAFGTLGFGASGACGRLFAAPLGWKPSATPNLVFGVIRDTHLMSSFGENEMPVWDRGKKADWKENPVRYLVAALKYFRERKVDAVMHGGDFADTGLMSEMMWHAEAWRRVFPRNRGLDGKKVEKLFVTGNHDCEGMPRARRAYPDDAEYARRMFNADIPGNWERIWGEQYEPVWHKTVKGYHFFGRHFGEDSMKMASLVKAGIQKFNLEDGAKPYFFLSHTGSCGAENEAFRQALSGLHNAVAFYGHWHSSFANWNTIKFWLGKTTPELQIPLYSPWFAYDQSMNCQYITTAKLENWQAGGAFRQGFIVNVYDDMIVFERHEFGTHGRIGEDWVLPLGESHPHPLCAERLRKRIGVPQFAEEAKLKFVRCGEDAFNVLVPLAGANPGARVFAYELQVTDGAGEIRLVKASIASGCNVAVGSEPDGGVTAITVKRSELPTGKNIVFAVYPLTSLGTRGQPLAQKVKRRSWN